MGGQQQVPVEEQECPPETPDHAGSAPNRGPAQRVVWPRHLQVAVERHGREEDHAGRAVGGNHEQVDFAGGVAEAPGLVKEVVIDAKGQVEDQEEICDHQADQEHGVGRPGPRAQSEDE